MPYSLAIFDWNGTLIDDTFANHAGANAEFRALGAPEISLERYRETMEFPFIHCFNRNGVDSDTYLKNRDLMQRVFMDVYDPLQKTAPLRRGAMEVLDYLLDKNITLMVLSNHVQDHLEEQMAERHVHGKFKHICGNPDISAMVVTKLNKRERLQKVINDNGYNPKDAFIIGDSLEEPAIAEHFGMPCVSVSWGCFARDRLVAVNPDRVIDELAELPKILQI